MIAMLRLHCRRRAHRSDQAARVARLIRPGTDLFPITLAPLTAPGRWARNPSAGELPSSAFVKFRDRLVRGASEPASRSTVSGKRRTRRIRSAACAFGLARPAARPLADIASPSTVRSIALRAEALHPVRGDVFTAAGPAIA